MSQKKTRDRRERIEQMRAAQQQAERRRRILIAGIGALVAAVAVAALVVGVLSNGGGETPNVSGDGGNPPWAAPADPQPNIQAAGLDTGPMGTAEHYHAHLDVFVDGEKVEVPADIGIVPSGAMSALHTHDTRGVLHVEARVKGEDYTLGQVFTQWGVNLSETRIGALKTGGGKTLTAYVNGDEHDGDPAGIVLKAHMQVALVYGKPDPSFTPPASYKFEQGE